MKNRIMSLLLCLLFALSMAMPASAELMVKAPSPTSIKLNASARSILPGGFYQLKATIKPAKASKAVNWTSDNASVATVNASGLVTAKAQGSCTITATTANGVKSATCVVTVEYAYGTSKVRYFGIANYRYPHPKAYGGQSLASPYNDQYVLMRDVYENASFMGSKVKMYKKQNLTGSGIRTLLKGMSSKYGIKKTDVTIFYYTGHGAGGSGVPAEYQGALCGVDASKPGAGYKPYVRVSEVQKYLDKVPGTVIVILDSCFSGQFAQSKVVISKGMTADTEAFTNAWVSAFSQSTADNFVVNKALSGSKYAHKYKILAACSPVELSWLTVLPYGYQEGPLSLFTYAFWDGAYPYLKSGVRTMDADADSDRFVSLTEVYNHARTMVNNVLMPHLIAQALEDGEDYRGTTQTVTMWPPNDLFPLSSST